MEQKQFIKQSMIVIKELEESSEIDILENKESINIALGEMLNKNLIINRTHELTKKMLEIYIRFKSDGVRIVNEK